jgi:ABC-2 type transport system permease protein
MIRAIVFLLSRSLKNRVLLRLKRLRQPKYLISAIAGLAYLYFVILRYSFVSRSPAPPEPPAPHESSITLAETALAFLLFMTVVFQWIFSNSQKALFKEAEIQFFFPAPISRKALIHYLIAKAQTGIAFGTLISFFIFGRSRLISHAGFFLITLWLVYDFLYLNRIVIFLVKRSRSRRLWALGFLLFSVLSTLFWILRFLPPPPMTEGLVPADLFAWMEQLGESGPLLCLLFPFRLLIRPAFASGFVQFVVRVAPSVAIIGFVYGWILRGNSTFEESVLGHAGKEADLWKAPGAQRTSGGQSRQPPFRLKPQGFAPVAVYWKNLFLAVGFSARRTIPALAALTLLFLLIINASGESVPMIIGTTAAVLACFLALLGPVIFREDLRTDLKYVDLLKTYPVRGWEIVLGEILGPATVLAVLEWILVLIAVSVLPVIEKAPWNVFARIFIGLGAVLVMPCLSLIGILIQNAAVLLLPGWVQLGREHQRGVEAMGQRLISSIATALSLLVAAVPAALLFLAVFLAGHWIMGLAAVPIASLLAALALLVEAGVGILWLGNLFERFDPSEEIL